MRIAIAGASGRMGRTLIELVSQSADLSQAAEINRVVTDDISATHDRKADRTCLARPGVTVARPGGNIVKRFTPSLRNGFTHFERRA